MRDAWARMRWVLIQPCSSLGPLAPIHRLPARKLATNACPDTHSDARPHPQPTTAQVLDEVCRMANYLRSLGVEKGDAVSVYMPMTCELPIAMLACARIGAVHSVVFGGFSAEALAGETSARGEEGFGFAVVVVCCA